MNILDKILHAGEGKKIRELEEVANQVNALESIYKEMTDEELKGQTLEFKKRYWGKSWKKVNEIYEDGDVLTDEIDFEPIEGESLEKLMPEAFGVVREAARRTIGLRHFDVQLMGGAALFKGNIAEMKTGEGKTLVATLPAYLASIAGLGVHVVTVNDYLASSQSEMMGRVFRFLGVSCGCILNNMNPQERRKEYDKDITYGTNNEFGFDYLRDNMAMNKEDLVQRGYFFAIVDEVDSILIDEARTPLIISGHAAGDLNKYYIDFAKFVKTLDPVTNIDPNKVYLPGEEKPEPNGDYEVDEKKKTIGVLDTAIDKLEAHLGIDNLYDSVNTPLVQFLQNAIRAKELFHRDKDYIVQNGEVKIVDEHTGRVLDGRRYSEGIHQAIEAKEGVKIQAENQTYATITLQNYFRMYKTLSGMTGTAETEAAEFSSTYELGVLPIPTNKPMIRIDHTDWIFRTEEGKFKAIVTDVAERHAKGQPILLGTASVEKSELLSKALKESGIKHEVLNAKQHAREAAIVARAGRKGAVTVATNMAGRGTDIMLGGNSEFLATEKMRELGYDPIENPEEYEKNWVNVLEESKKKVAAEHDEVADLGGLYVIGTERHESRRIDNQLRGRSGRQGDPGESRFFISMEDDLMRLFNTAMMQRVMAMGVPDDQPIEAKPVAKSIRNAQSQVESQNFEIRKNVLKYDEVMNLQREVVYKERKKVLMGVNMAPQIKTYIDQTVSGIVADYTLEGSPEEWDLDRLFRELGQMYPISFTPEDLIDQVGARGALNPQNITTEVVSDAEIEYGKRVEFAGEETMRNIERQITLIVLDRSWRQHLVTMDYIRNGIGLRAMAQKDPLVEYRNELTMAFNAMNGTIRRDIVQALFKITIGKVDEQGNKIEMTEGNDIVVTEMSGPDQEASGGGFQNERAVKASNGAINDDTVRRSADGMITKKTHTDEDDPYTGTPRNALCPCGSGKKYKDCHGKRK
ncbi:MAG: preprotein translocase subunit SecA [Candidatus Ancillula sp.]|nr:preprotein translocase subunit SecA [Candidatus Ancillula sp.]